jgi:AcrR family transcriptional regulator
MTMASLRGHAAASGLPRRADAGDGDGAPAKMNGHVERSRRSTAALLDAAGELIVEGGFDSLTLATIGQRAGYSRGIVTARFGSKQGLLTALVERITVLWGHRNLVPFSTGKPGRESLIILLDAIQRQAARDTHGLRVLYALIFEALGPNEMLRNHFIEFHRVMRGDLVAMLERGIKDGSVRPGLSPEDEATLVLAGLRGIAYQWTLEPSTFDPAAALAYLTKTTDDRLRPPRAPRSATRSNRH